VFSGDVENLRGAWALQRREVLIGTLVGVCATLLLVNARLAPFILVALTAAWLSARLPDRGIAAATPPLDGLAISFGTLLLYVVLSLLWAADPRAAIGKVSLLVAVVLMSLVTAKVVSVEGRDGILHAAEGLWIGLLVGLLFYLIEGVTRQGLYIWIVNTFNISHDLLQPAKEYKWAHGKLVRISQAALTRNGTPTTLLLWPAMMAALGAIVRPWNTRIAVLLLVIAFLAVFFSPQESSKTAIIAGLIGFGLTWLSSRWAHRAIASAWVIACLAVVPLVLLAHRLELHNAPWLQHSAQHRIIIWNFTAEQVLKSPIFGIGAYMTYVTGPAITATAVNTPDEHLRRKISRHSHDIYLQTWFELGAIGALLLTAAGLAILDRIRRLGPAVQPFGFATFCSAATVMASSFGIWQSWYMALFGLTPIAFAIGARAYETAGSAEGITTSASI
jgi:O-antigen ligase